MCLYCSLHRVAHVYVLLITSRCTCVCTAHYIALHMCMYCSLHRVAHVYVLLIASRCTSACTGLFIALHMYNCSFHRICTWYDIVLFNTSRCVLMCLYCSLHSAAHYCFVCVYW